MSADPGRRLVLGCTACQRTWEPDLTGPVAAWQTCCPSCGGWTWIAQLLDAATPPDAAAGGARW